MKLNHLRGPFDMNQFDTPTLKGFFGDLTVVFEITVKFTSLCQTMFSKTMAQLIAEYAHKTVSVMAR